MIGRESPRVIPNPSPVAKTPRASSFFDRRAADIDGGRGPSDGNGARAREFIASRERSLKRRTEARSATFRRRCDGRWKFG